MHSGEAPTRPIPVTRRSLLKGTAAAGLGVSASAALWQVITDKALAHGFQAGGPPTGSVVWALTADPASLVPYGSSSTSNMQGKEFMYDSLLEWDRDLNIQPALAESYETADDLMSYVFHLRRGVLFHNGQEMTAADVKYSLHLSLNPEPPILPSPYLANVSGVEIVDDYTVRITTSVPDPTIPGVLAWQRMTPIFPNGIGEEINFLSEGIGTGPFKLIEYVPNSYLTYEAFPDYWNPGIPCVQNLTLQIVTDEPARVAFLRSGEIDGGTFSADSVAAFEDDDQFEVLSGLFSAPRLLYVNTARDVPWRDVRVRQAVSKTIDRQEIIDKVYAGDAVLTGPIPPGYGDWALPEETLKEIYTVDVEGAKALMAEAGYADGFSVELAAISAPREYTQIAELIREQLKHINIDVSVVPQEIGTFVETINSTFDWASTGAGMRADPSGYVVQFRSGNSTFETQIGDGWISEEFDQLYDEALATSDNARRHELYTRLQEIIIRDEAINFYTVQPVKFQVVNKRLTGMYVAYTDFNTGLRYACVTDS